MRWIDPIPFPPIPMPPATTSPTALHMRVIELERRNRDLEDQVHGLRCKEAAATAVAPERVDKLQALLGEANMRANKLGDTCGNLKHELAAESLEVRKLQIQVRDLEGKLARVRR